MSLFESDFVCWTVLVCSKLLSKKTLNFRIVVIKPVLVCLLGTSIVCLAAVLTSGFNLAQFSSVFPLVKTCTRRLKNSFCRATVMAW